MLLSTRLAGSDQRNRRVVLSDWSIDAGNRVLGPVWTDIEVTPKAFYAGSLEKKDVSIALNKIRPYEMCYVRTLRN